MESGTDSVITCGDGIAAHMIRNVQVVPDRLGPKALE